MSSIRISQITKHYGTVEALRGISLEMARGRRFGLIGPDGAGKTTLMRILVGLLRPDSGAFTIGDLDGARDIGAIKATVGYMPQRFSLYPDLTVAENLAFFGDLFGMDRNRMAERRKRLMEFSRLDPFLDRRAGRLSGGMKQKLALSCALIHTPAVLILDEPTTGVDPLSRREFWTILKELSDNEGVTVLVSTPYMDEAMQCHRIGFLHRGRLLAEGEPPSVIAGFPWKILEITGPDVHRLTQEGEPLPGVRSTRILGDRIRLAVEQADASMELWSRLPQWSPEWTIRRGQPDLDDVFTELIGSDHAENGAERLEGAVGAGTPKGDRPGQATGSGGVS